MTRKILATLLAMMMILSFANFSVFASEELPTYEATKLDVKTISTSTGDFLLKAGMNFKAMQTPEEVKGKYYENYNADFVISFSKDVSADEVALAGYYSEYCDKYNNGKWVVLPLSLEEGTIIPANTPIRVMKLFEQNTDIDVSEYSGVSYKDIVTLIKSFDCGVITAGNANESVFRVSVKLNFYETELANGKYVETGNVFSAGNAHRFYVGEVEEYLPGYEAEELEIKNISTNGGDFVLVKGMNFKATQTPEEVKGEFYEYYGADFVIKFDRDVCTDDIALAGYYSEYCDKYNNGKWVVLPLSTEEGTIIPANTPIRVMKLFESNDEVATSKYNGLVYKDLVTFVKSFDCGIITSNGADIEGLGVELSLNLYETENVNGEYVETGVVYDAYEAYNFTLKSIESYLPSYEAKYIGSKEIAAKDANYNLYMGMNFKATQTAEDADGKFYEYYNADFVLTFNKDVCADDVALAGYYSEYCDKYNDGKWVVFPLSTEEGAIIPANTPIRVMKLFEQNGGVDVSKYNGVTYKDIVTLIKSFDCGVVMTNPEKYDGLESEISLNFYATSNENGEYVENGVVYSAGKSHKLSYISNIVVENVLKAEAAEETTEYIVSLAGALKDGILVGAFYSEDGRLLEMAYAPVNAQESTYSLALDNDSIAKADYAKFFVWNSFAEMTSLSAEFKKKITEIENVPVEEIPDETVKLNYSDDFIYRFGTINEVPIHATYEIDGVETEITEENVVFEAETVLGSASVTSDKVTIVNGKPRMSLTGSGQVKLTAYPKNFADDESKKVSFTFEVLDGYYNVSSIAKADSYQLFCLAEDVENFTVYLNGDVTAYGNDYTIDYSNIKPSAGSVNGGCITLYNGATIDNFRVVGVYTDDYYVGTNTNISNNNPEYTWSCVKIYEEGHVLNSHISYCKAGVRVYSGTGYVENTTIYNSVMPVSLNSATTVNLDNVAIDQILTDEDVQNGHKYGAAVVGEAGTPVKINVNGDVYFHSFIGENENDKLPENVSSFISMVFSDSNANGLFTKDGVKYVNPAFIITGSSYNDSVINISENSNLYDKLTSITKSTSLGSAKVWTYDSTKTSIDEVAPLFEKPSYNITAGTNQIKAVAKNLLAETSVQAVNGVATYDFSNVYFEKYGERLSYEAVASVGTVSGNVLSIPATEDTASILTFKVFDKFSNETITFETAVYATVPAYAPMLVFAAPSGKNTGASSSAVFEYYGRNCGNTFDPDFDIDLDSLYGFAAYDYKGNVIPYSSTATTGARVTVSAVVTAGIGTTRVTAAGTGYFSTLSDKTTSDSYTTIEVTYTAYDAAGRSTTAKRYYRISNSTSGTFIKSYKNWKSSDAYAFASRNSFSNITLTWNGVNNVTSSTNNHYIVAGAMEQ